MKLLRGIISRISQYLFKVSCSAAAVVACNAGFTHWLSPGCLSNMRLMSHHPNLLNWRASKPAKDLSADKRISTAGRAFNTPYAPSVKISTSRRIFAFAAGNPPSSAFNP